MCFVVVVFMFAYILIYICVFDCLVCCSGFRALGLLGCCDLVGGPFGFADCLTSGVY